MSNFPFDSPIRVTQVQSQGSGSYHRTLFLLFELFGVPCSLEFTHTFEPPATTLVSLTSGCWRSGCRGETCCSNSPFSRCGTSYQSSIQRTGEVDRPSEGLSRFTASLAEGHEWGDPLERTLISSTLATVFSEWVTTAVEASFMARYENFDEHAKELGFVLEDFAYDHLEAFSPVVSAGRR